MDTTQLPKWLAALLGEKFFKMCLVHEDVKKNEKNLFCLDCCEGFCHRCLPEHDSHKLLQIRRYVYHDVIRVADAEKLMDCSYVQTYISNSSKVVFINQRPPTTSSRNHSNNLCITCDRSLQKDYFLYCSLSCKLQEIQKSGEDLSKVIRNCESLALPEPGLDDGQLTADSVLEPAGSASGSSSCGGTGALVDGLSLACTATTTEVVRKKRSNLTGLKSGFRPVCRPVSEISHEGMMNRRKSTPHRAPMY